MQICLKCKNNINETDWSCPNCMFTPTLYKAIYLFDPDSAFNNMYFNIPQLKLYREYENTNFWLLYRKKMIINLITKYMKNKKLNSFFEIGCGTGYILEEVQNKFPDTTIYGSDIFYQSINFVAERLKKGQFIQMNALNIPYKEQFDAIGIFDVLEHIDDDEKVLQQIHQSLKEDGKLFVIVPQHQFLWSNSDEHSGHKRRYSYKDLRKKLINNGFNIEFKTSFMCFLMPLMLLARFIKKFSKKNADINDEIKINPILNNIFKFILSIECWFINHNTNFLWGGSLVIVATRRNK